jgi:CubicO group peptidase (beta-lactamase class C family)
MRPHDMAKIGFLYLNNGWWDGKQIVSSGWVEDSTRKQVTTTGSWGYGYQWWTTGSGRYLAMGYGGQFIFVVPDKNVIAVFTSHLSGKDQFIPSRLLKLNIIPSVKSDNPLPENRQAEKAFKALLMLWRETSPGERP